MRRPVLLLVVFILCIFEQKRGVFVSAGLDIEIGDAGESLGGTSDAVEKVQSLLTSGTPGKIFKNIGRTLSALGPALMAVSAIISIVTMFLPQEDSPELKAIKKGFKKVNRKLDVITDEIKNLKGVIELNNAKSAFTKYVTIINKNYDNLQSAMTAKTNESYKYFKYKYSETYGMAHEHMYDALMGSNGQMGFNLVQIYQDFVSCNPVLISKFCVVGIMLINKGLAVEGTMLGYMKFQAKVNSQKKVWKDKMTKLSDMCSKRIDKCEKDWNFYANREFDKVYKSAMKADTKAYARSIANAMNDAVGQRLWLAVVYKDTSGYDDHCFSSPGINERRKWHQHNYCVTLFSKPKSRIVNSASINKLRSSLKARMNIASRVNNCRKTVFLFIKKDRYKGEHAKVIYKYLKPAVRCGLLYVIGMNTNPNYHYTGRGDLIVETQYWRCRGHKYRIISYPC